MKSFNIGRSTVKLMEPKILLIGRKQEVIDILAEELNMFGRDVRGSNDKLRITSILQNEPISFIVIGAGLPDEVREELAAYVTGIRPDVGIFLIAQTEKSSPYNMIEFTNRKAVEWKVEQKIGKRPAVRPQG
ncbi:MAG: PleD family two-component response regulator [Granulosicoccus sp.]